MATRQLSLQDSAKHVSYEMEMLMFSASELGGWHSSPMSKPAGNHENMALESFLLHFRNLRGFLCPKLQRTWPDDIVASKFLGNAEAVDVVDRRNLSRDKERIDKMLAHLSHSREHFIEARKHGWPVAKMLLEMLEQLEIFLGMLSPEKRAWFPSADEISDSKSRASYLLEDQGQATWTTTSPSVVVVSMPFLEENGPTSGTRISKIGETIPGSKDVPPSTPDR